MGKFHPDLRPVKIALRCSKKRGIVETATLLPHAQALAFGHPRYSFDRPALSPSGRSRHAFCVTVDGQTVRDEKAAPTKSDDSRPQNRGQVAWRLSELPAVMEE